ncbi:MAG: hypothetical protein ACKVZJ_13405 [Phycisphaerales bacterium]
MTTRSNILSACVLASACGAAHFVPQPVAFARQGGVDAVAGSTRADNYRRLQKPVTIELNGQKLGDIVTFLRDLTGANIDPVWTDERAEGLDPEQQITLSVRDQPAIRLLEKVLDKCGQNAGEATWQFDSAGAVQIGLKSSLNKFGTLVIYDIRDLLFELPDYNQVPELDLNSVLSQGGSAGGGGGGGGGGGSSLFGGGGGAGGDQNRPIDDERAAQRIIDLITETVEPSQWQDNGGDGGTIRFYNGNLLIKAPDYMHRRIVGYSFMR